MPHSFSSVAFSPHYSLPFPPVHPNTPIQLWADFEKQDRIAVKKILFPPFNRQWWCDRHSPAGEQIGSLELRALLQNGKTGNLFLQCRLTLRQDENPLGAELFGNTHPLHFGVFHYTELENNRLHLAGLVSQTKEEEKGSVVQGRFSLLICFFFLLPIFQSQRLMQLLKDPGMIYLSKVWHFLGSIFFFLPVQPTNRCHYFVMQACSGSINYKLMLQRC